MTSAEKPICAWCGQPFERASTRGPKPAYCSASHRQRAYESRKQVRFAQTVLKDARLRNHLENSLATAAGAGVQAQMNSALAMAAGAGVQAHMKSVLAMAAGAGAQMNSALAMAAGAGVQAQMKNALAMAAGAGAQVNSALAVAAGGGLQEQLNKSLAMLAGAGVQAQMKNALAIAAGAGVQELSKSLAMLAGGGLQEQLNKSLATLAGGGLQERMGALTSALTAPDLEDRFHREIESMQRVSAWLFEPADVEAALTRLAAEPLEDLAEEEDERLAGQLWRPLAIACLVALVAYPQLRHAAASLGEDALQTLSFLLSLVTGVYEESPEVQGFVHVLAIASGVTALASKRGFSRPEEQ